MGKRFVIIGGGTGTYSILFGLKQYTNNITAVVNMADSGGSARKERDEWGLLPSSDIRKSLLALADVSTQDALLLRKLFQYRYNQGKGISGMTFGNLFLVALTKLLGSQEKAIQKTSDILRIKGQVLPVTLDKIDLVAQYEDKSVVIGEHFIDEPKHNGKIRIKHLSTTPPAHITEPVKKAIKNADVIIIGPGGFYTTILASLVIGGLKMSILDSSAKKIFILNLMTEYGQTYGFTASTFLNELNKYLPVNCLDFIFVNNAPIPSKILKRYEKYKATSVVNDIRAAVPYKIISEDFLADTFPKKEKGDTLTRSLIRHSPEKLARMCMKVLGLL